MGPEKDANYRQKIRKVELLLLKKKEISIETCQKNIKEQKLNIKKKNTGKIKNLSIFLSSDNFAFA